MVGPQVCSCGAHPKVLRRRFVAVWVECNKSLKQRHSLVNVEDVNYQQLGFCPLHFGKAQNCTNNEVDDGLRSTSLKWLAQRTDFVGQ